MSRHSERETLICLLYEYSFHDGLSADDFLKAKAEAMTEDNDGDGIGGEQCEAMPAASPAGGADGANGAEGVGAAAPEIFSEFVRTAFVGCVASAGELDRRISEFSKGWKISRISRIAKSILRLAVYETVFTETPPKAVINEAVELAKTYDDERSAKFINGILNSFARAEGYIADTKGDAAEKSGDVAEDGSADHD